LHEIKLFVLCHDYEQFPNYCDTNVYLQPRFSFYYFGHIVVWPRYVLLCAFPWSFDAMPSCKYDVHLWSWQILGKFRRKGYLIIISAFFDHWNNAGLQFYETPIGIEFRAGFLVVNPANGQPVTVEMIDQEDIVRFTVLRSIVVDLAENEFGEDKAE